MADVPEHLLKRSQERRKALGLPVEGEEAAPAPEAEEVAPEEAAAATPVRDSRVRVLVADDSAIERRCLHAVLSRDPRLVPLEVNDGLEAWEQLDGGLNPVLCIFDIMMPRLNGLDVVEKMRADPRFGRTPVVLCTAVTDRETVIRAAPLGVIYYLVKPYSSADILAQVDKVLGKDMGRLGVV